MSLRSRSTNWSAVPSPSRSSMTRLRRRNTFGRRRIAIRLGAGQDPLPNPGVADTRPSKPEIARSIGRSRRAVAAERSRRCGLWPRRQVPSGLGARGHARAVGVARHQKTCPAAIKLIFPVAGRSRPSKRQVPNVLSVQQVHQQLKKELGLDYFDGRSSWRGLHRHALMTTIAYAFLQHRHLARRERGKESILARLNRRSPQSKEPSSSR